MPAGRNMDSVIAAQLEAMSNDLQSIAALQDEIQDLRLAIETLTERVDELLGTMRGSDESHVNDEDAGTAAEDSGIP